jgi:hypothetical protein
MAEFPDANSGGLDPSGASKPKAPLWKRVRAWTIIVALYAIFLGMAAGAVPLLRSVFRPGVPVEDRLLHLVWAVGLLTPLGIVLRYFVRVRLKTGLWRGTPEQRKQEREQRRAQCSPATGCAARKNTWTRYVVRWASYAAMDRTRPMPQRVAGWAVLVLYVVAVLAFVALGVICLGAAFADNNSITATLVFIGFGIAVLLWPALAVISLVRGVRAGKLGATREEIEQMQAQRSVQRQRDWQKPLRSKIINTTVSCAIYALWWLRVTVHHAQHPHESWVTPAMTTPFLIYSIWIQFRRPKSAAPPAA